MKKALFLLLVFCGVSAFAQNTLTANFGYIPTTNVPACTAAVTTSCVSGFRFQTVTSQSATPVPATDPVIGTMSVTIAQNTDGSWKTCTSPNLSCITGTVTSAVIFKLGSNYLYGVTVYKDATGAALITQATSAVAAAFLEPQAPNNLKATIP